MKIKGSTIPEWKSWRALIGATGPRKRNALKHYKSKQWASFLIYKIHGYWLGLYWQIPTNDLGLRMVKASLFIYQPDRVMRKASDVQQLIGDIKHTWKNTIFFHVCCCGFSQGWKLLYNTIVYMINCFNTAFLHFSDDDHAIMSSHHVCSVCWRFSSSHNVRTQISRGKITGRSSLNCLFCFWCFAFYDFTFDISVLSDAFTTVLFEVKVLKSIWIIFKLKQ